MLVILTGMCMIMVIMLIHAVGITLIMVSIRSITERVLTKVVILFMRLVRVFISGGVIMIIVIRNRNWVCMPMIRVMLSMMMLTRFVLMVGA